MCILTSLLVMLGLAASSALADLTADDFEKLIGQPDVVIIDVRTPEEFAEGHIAGAINVDVNSENFKESIAALKLKKNATIAVYCRSGRRSANACAILKKEGYRHLNNLSTGILGWIEAGKQVVK